ncbi:T-cell activation inhibitor, mitochondrial isoform X2 [Arctopsyche grandis]|uniref:T-cell activation inhibitor, mitochondrial isoform X2 n=1 Tax=Arctopsyche grandis TaxID=121162 RepID=UPI00406D9F1F
MTIGIFCRHLSTAEVSTALRPFYFSVHPDLFGRYPEQRSVNENSLKQLSALLEAQQTKTLLPSTTLSFYLREKSQPKGNFKLINIILSGNNVRQSVLAVLKACQLPTDYVDKISKPIPKSNNFKTFGYNTPFDENDPFYTSFIMKEQVSRVKDLNSLNSWVKKNYSSARTKYDSTKATRDHISELQNSLTTKYLLKEIKWDSGWNVSHIRGSLQSFNALATQHPFEMSNLKGRTLVFGQFTGVSLDGDVYLGNTEVRNNWLDSIKKVKQHDDALLSIPMYEKTLSTVLRDIHIKRRKFMPKIQAAEYCKQLRHLTTSLEDVHTSGNGFPKSVPKSLSNYEIVVEQEAGPLMISPTGQIITPSSCPGDQLVSFIAAHLDEAMEGLTQYKINKHTERTLHKECVSRLGLLELMKDDCVTPDRMIQCCQHLLQHASELQNDFQGISLWVTSYYSVLSDGMMCIPWDWKW